MGVGALNGTEGVVGMYRVVVVGVQLIRVCWMGDVQGTGSDEWGLE